MNNYQEYFDTSFQFWYEEMKRIVEEGEGGMGTLKSRGEWSQLQGNALNLDSPSTFPLAPYPSNSQGNCVPFFTIMELPNKVASFHCNGLGPRNIGREYG